MPGYWGQGFYFISTFMKRRIYIWELPKSKELQKIQVQDWKQKILNRHINYAGITLKTNTSYPKFYKILMQSTLHQLPTHKIFTCYTVNEYICLVKLTSVLSTFNHIQLFQALLQLHQDITSFNYKTPCNLVNRTKHCYYYDYYIQYITRESNWPRDIYRTSTIGNET